MLGKKSRTSLEAICLASAMEVEDLVEVISDQAKIKSKLTTMKDGEKAMTKEAILHYYYLLNFVKAFLMGNAKHLCDKIKNLYVKNPFRTCMHEGRGEVVKCKFGKKVAQ